MTRTTEAEIESLFDTALQHRSPGFALGATLARLHPDLAILEGGGLDLQSFAHAGHCTIEPRADLYNQFETEWYPDHGVHTRPRVAWLRVTWERAVFDVVLLAWEGSMGRPAQHHVILGKTRELCVEFFEAVSRWNHEVRGEILVFADGCFSKSQKLYDAVMAASFDQLVLEGSFKQQIADDFSQFLASRATYEEHGVPWRRGALFIGPPGNGKTLCVKALVRQMAIPCMYVQSFEAQYATVQRSIETVFKRARATAPCVLVLEDIDALLNSGSRSFFLNELDGFATNTGVITLATTNHPERLDPSIIERPSRFDRKYYFELPATATRATYVASWNERLRPALRLDDAGRERVVEATEGFSFAYIQELFVSAMMRWVATRDPAGILPLALEQVAQLRDQMTRAMAEPPPEPPSTSSPRSRVGRGR